MFWTLTSLCNVIRVSQTLQMLLYEEGQEADSWEEKVRSGRFGEEKGIVLLKLTLPLRMLKTCGKAPSTVPGVVHSLPVLSRIPL